MADKAKPETRNNIVGERHACDDQKCGQAVGNVAEIYFFDILHHKRADKNKAGRCGHCRNEQNQRRKNKGNKEKHGAGYGRQSRASAFGYARDAFQITGDGACAEQRAHERSRGVRKGGGFQAADNAAAVFAEFGCKADERAHGIEQVDHGHAEENGQKAYFENLTEFQLHEYGRYARNVGADNVFYARRCGADAEQY